MHAWNAGNESKASALSPALSGDRRNSVMFKVQTAATFPLATPGRRCSMFAYSFWIVLRDYAQHVLTPKNQSLDIFLL